MNILHCTNRLGASGGSEIYLQQLIARQKERGHNVEVRVPGDSTQALFAPDVIHIHAHGFDPLPWIQAASSRPKIVSTMHDYSPICPGGQKYYPGQGRACDVTFGPVCMTRAYTHRCNRTRKPMGVWNHWTETRNLLEALRQSDRIVVASIFMKNTLVRHGFDENKVSVIPYFIETPPVESLPRAGVPRLLFAGRFLESKGVLDLIAIASRIRQPFELTLIGDGPDRGKIIRAISQANLSSSIRLLPWLPRPELLSAMGSSTLFLFPSLWDEPFGIVGVEAGAMGLPVVAYDVGGIREWLQHGVNGYLVDRGRTDSFASSIRGLLENHSAREGMGHSARVLAHRFSRDSHLSLLEMVYQG